MWNLNISMRSSVLFFRRAFRRVPRLLHAALLLVMLVPRNARAGAVDAAIYLVGIGTPCGASIAGAAVGGAADLGFAGYQIARAVHQQPMEPPVLIGQSGVMVLQGFLSGLGIAAIRKQDHSGSTCELAANGILLSSATVMLIEGLSMLGMLTSGSPPTAVLPKGLSVASPAVMLEKGPVAPRSLGLSFQIKF